MKKIFWISILVSVNGSSLFIRAQAAPVAGAPVLLASPGARPVALGESTAAGANDITSFLYNPAALTSLNQAQLSFFYEKGIEKDSYGDFSGGFASHDRGYGFSAGYY